jgi:hypothetical protein
MHKSDSEVPTYMLYPRYRQWKLLRTIITSAADGEFRSAEPLGCQAVGQKVCKYKFTAEDTVFYAGIKSGQFVIGLFDNAF